MTQATETARRPGAFSHEATNDAYKKAQKTEALTGWELLRSPLPPEALAPLGAEAGYGPGMTAIDKPFIYAHLIASGLDWAVEAVLFEDQPRTKTFQTGPKDGFEVVCTLSLMIDGKRFPGVGGDWSGQWGDARKGAFTDAIGRAAMLAGIGLEVWTDRLTAEQKAHVDKLRKETPNPSQGQSPGPAATTPAQGGGFDVVRATEAAKEAWTKLASQYPTCGNHGDTMLAHFKPDKNKGLPWLSCGEKVDGGFCPTKPLWILPASVAAAIAASEGVAPTPAEEEIPWP